MYRNATHRALPPPVTPHACRGRVAAWLLTLLAALTVILFVIAIPARAVETADTLSLEAHRGKVVLVDFWASWCSPCRQAFPWLNAMQAKYADDGLVIIGVNVDEEFDDAQRFLDSVPAHFELVYDPQGKLAREFDVQAMPSSYIIGRNGKVVMQHFGFLSRKTAQYEQALIDALTQPAVAATGGIPDPD